MLINNREISLLNFSFKVIIEKMNRQVCKIDVVVERRTAQTRSHAKISPINCVIVPGKHSQKRKSVDFHIRYIIY